MKLSHMWLDDVTVDKVSDHNMMDVEYLMKLVEVETEM